MRLAISSSGGPAIGAISPLMELGAYEAMWLEEGASFKRIADRFAADPDALPSDFISAAVARQRAQEVLNKLKGQGVHRFGVRVHHAGDYPPKLRDARHPIELLYYQGTWELVETRCVAVVGSRKATEKGVRRARRLARELVARNFTVVSGLATGIDTAVHRAAIEAGGRTIAVIGTPLGEVYPKENRELQEQIASEFLVVSQVPALRYAAQKWFQNRLFFPERNITMSALTEGTIIVEAGDTSGTLTQARAALHQRRRLFILDSCFERKSITWPARYEGMGGIRVRDLDDIWTALGPGPL
jgi:DNA processing protein